MTSTLDLPTSTPPRRRAAKTVAATAVGLAAVVAAPALTANAAPTAAVTAVADDEAERHDRLERLCAKARHQLVHTKRLIDRIEGGPAVEGSIKWLQHLLFHAREQGLEDRVVMLENRIAVRTAQLEFLKIRARYLVEVIQLCDELGA
ncbi:MAG: hypothetical protein HKN41_01430 [Ilumatobacter sp.]|nr:hypothetical protein [Ilumatobacter sp.]